MVEAGGPLTQYIKETFFPRNKEHVQRVQDEHRALARPTPVDFGIVWLSDAPPSTTVYTKRNMGMKRRLEWIKWKAAKLNLDLTPVTFMALFKQLSCYENNEGCINKYKAMMKHWQGTSTGRTCRRTSAN